MKAWIPIAVVAGVVGAAGCCSDASSSQGDAAPDGAVTDVTPADVGADVDASSPDTGPDVAQPDAAPDVADAGDVMDAGDAMDAGDVADASDVTDASDGGDVPDALPMPCAPCTGDGCAIVEVTTGASYSCARRASGSVLCWGANAYGTLGNGTTTASPRPVEVLGVCDAVEVEAGSNAACVRRRSGQISCWGANISGVLGIGRTYEELNLSTTPRDVAGLDDAISIDGGAGFFCVVRRGGAVWCWGTNSAGQLGDGTTGMNHSSPVPVPGLVDISRVTTAQSGCALRTGGQVVCWGRNYRGRLGTGDEADHFSPTPVVGLTGATSVATGVWHTCALRSDATISCWGDNALATLGSAPSPVVTTMPVAVAGVAGVTQLEVGYRHTCVLLRDGTVSCWGKNDLGELGRGSTSPFEATPALVMGLSDVTQIASHSPHDVPLEGGHTCALRRDGSVVCWGKNDVGQLGDGTTMTRAAPVAVRF